MLSDAESDAAVDRFRTHQRFHGFCFWALETRKTQEFIGFVGLNIYRWRTPSLPVIEIGWRLAHAFWGKGLATEAARAVLEFGFEELLLDEIVAVTATTNVRSQRVMLRLGMQCSESDNFRYPALPEHHHLSAQVMHRLSRADWRNSER